MEFTERTMKQSSILMIALCFALIGCGAGASDESANVGESSVAAENSATARRVADSGELDAETLAKFDEYRSSDDEAVRNLLSGQLLVAVENGAMGKDEAISEAEAMKAKAENPEIWDSTIAKINEM